MRAAALLVIIAAVGLVTGCKKSSAEEPAVAEAPASVNPPTSAPADQGASARAGAADPATLARLESKPLFEFTERDVDVYLAALAYSEPDLHRRIVTLARKNLGQPYEIYLLGESPFETTDAQPVYCLTKSDCVVFAEHTLAMALSDSWPSFLGMLQRIRYDGGAIGVLTRNHYTEADWNRHNAWLVRDVTDEIGGGGSDGGGADVVRFRQTVNRAKFFRDRYKLETSLPNETIDESFIPYEHVGSVKSKLRDGDVVNFVSGVGDNYWVGHVGLVALGPNGEVNLIHSASPRVREEPIDEYVRRSTRDAADRDAAGKARFRGFKFLRVHADPLANLRAIDGSRAPRVTVPPLSPVTWEQFVESFQSK